MLALGAAVLGTLVGLARRDYDAWRSLGVGGLPPTPGGWLVVTGLRLRRRDVLRPLRVPDGPPSALLDPLPERPRPRPRVAPHPIPHRVLDQHAESTEKASLTALLDTLVARDVPGLEYRTSRWERNNQALFLRSSPASDGTEVGHMHPSDGSMHVTLRSSDAAAVVARGWGEYHPLAGVTLGLPESYVLLYPPRRPEDLDAIGLVFEAAILRATDSAPATTPDRPADTPPGPRRPI